jgi:hypothetical protein
VWIYSDGTYEHAYASQFGECVPPDYGSFAERYVGQAHVLAVVLDLTADPYWENPYLDVYVWSDDDGMPGEVLAVVVRYHLLDVAYWPEVTRIVIDMPAPVCLGDSWWVGYWGHWPNDYGSFYIGADLNGPGGGTPMLKIAPGLQWPEGWQDVEVRWGPTAALGIGAEVEETPSPAVSQTWGCIKGLFR